MKKSLVELAGFGPTLWSAATKAMFDDEIRCGAPRFVVWMAERLQWGSVLKLFGVDVLQSDPKSLIQFIGCYHMRGHATRNGEV